MDRLTRLALMGYAYAQAEMCARGKLLPCPKCFKDSAKIIGDLEDFKYPITIDELQSTKNTRIAVACMECGIVSTTYELGDDKKDALIKLVVDWNTRPVPAIVRCDQCMYYDKSECWCNANETYLEPDDFCSYFDPKKETTNEE